MKVWITKYALTQGIFTIEADELISPVGITEVGAEYPTYCYGNEWHRTSEDAVQHLAVMIAAKRPRSDLYEFASG